MTPRPTTLTFTPWAVLYPTTTTPADAGANPRTGPWGANARGPVRCVATGSIMADMLWSALSYLGAAVLAYHALALLNVLYKTLLASGPKLTKKYGEWAVVTGATDGVGKAMSFELARKGCRRALRPPRAAVV